MFLVFFVLKKWYESVPKFCSGKAIAQICREGGPWFPCDAHRLEVIAEGLTLFGGSQLVKDATVVSPLHADGTHQRKADTTDVQALRGGIHASASLHSQEHVVQPQLTRADTAIVRYKRGPLSSVLFTTMPTNGTSRIDAENSQVFLLRRQRLPLQLSIRACRCGRLLTFLGHHRAVCSRAGVLGKRDFSSSFFFLHRMDATEHSITTHRTQTAENRTAYHVTCRLVQHVFSLAIPFRLPSQLPFRNCRCGRPPDSVTTEQLALEHSPRKKRVCGGDTGVHRVIHAWLEMHVAHHLGPENDVPEFFRCSRVQIIRGPRPKVCNVAQAGRETRASTESSEEAVERPSSTSRARRSAKECA